MNRTIMTVEDAAFMSGLMKAMFKSASYNVVAQAVNGMDGVEKFQAYRPEIVVLDIVMPVMDGLDTLSEIIKAEPCTKVVMCTALGHMDKVLLSLLNGASGYVVKPFQAETLISAVESVFVEKPVFCMRTIERYINHPEVKAFIDQKTMLSQESVDKLIEACKQDDIVDISFLCGVPIRRK